MNNTSQNSIILYKTLDNQPQIPPNFISNSSENSDNYVYHSFKLLINLYDSLLLSGDFLLALQASELIYSSMQINPHDFLNKNTCSYFIYYKNLQFIYDLENIYHIKAGNRSIPITNCHIIADKLANQILMFSPIISSGIPSDFFQKKVKTLEKARSSDKFLQGDFVIIFNEKQEFSFIAKLIEIDEIYRIKFEALLNNDLIKVLNSQKNVWFISKLFNNNQSEIAANNLIKFCCSDVLSYNLSEMLISPQSSHYTQEIPQEMPQNVDNSLNLSQNIAIKSAIFNSLTLIDGPRKSGKTTVIKAIIAEWYIIILSVKTEDS